MEKGYHKGQELTMSDLGLSLEELAGQPLELLACEGAKLVLTVALEEEVTEFLQCRRYERRQGYYQKPTLSPRQPRRHSWFSYAGAEDEVRTRDLLLGKETFYH